MASTLQSITSRKIVRLNRLDRSANMATFPCLVLGNMLVTFCIHFQTKQLVSLVTGFKSFHTFIQYNYILKLRHSIRKLPYSTFMYSIHLCICVRKLTYSIFMYSIHLCICETKGTNQPCSNSTADQHLCFCDFTGRFESDLVTTPNCWFLIQRHIDL